MTIKKALSKKTLSILLSKLKPFIRQQAKLEQYPTDSEIAADILWHMFMQNDIKGKVIADLGCGNGILGIGALILGAKKVFFVDIDKEAIKIADENVRAIKDALNADFNAEMLCMDVNGFSSRVDVVVQNPPFGVKKAHSDKIFLIKAMSIAKVVYSFHKVSTAKFIEKFAFANGFSAEFLNVYKFPIKKSFGFHTKSVYYTQVGFWRFSKQ